MDAQPASSTHMSRTQSRLFPALGPALLICSGYIDPGKWAAIVDGGSRFGSDHLFLLAAFSCAAMLCQYLSARVGVVTGKNLAQICSEEYNKSICILLGVQTELSRLILDLTMIQGVAHGLTLLFGLDILMSLFLSWIVTLVFPLLFAYLDKHQVDIVLTSMAASGMILYLLGVLSSQSELSVVGDGLLPRLRGESVYALMSILGSSIIPHNLYLHSFLVQEQRYSNFSVHDLCQDHLIGVLFTCSGNFLIHYMVMLAAGNIFHSASLTVLTFQDSLLLWDQVFRNPLAVTAFFLVLFFSSQVTAVSWNGGSRVLGCHFFGVDFPGWIHHVLIKLLVFIPCLYCALSSGAEGIYQMLIFTQVILAMLLPSSVIPLFRVASSTSIMGGYKISGYVEIFALATSLSMVALNLIFIVEMLFGNGELSDSVHWNMGSCSTFSYLILLLTAFASLGLMLWLAATPLKSASVDIRFRNWDAQSYLLEPVADTGGSQLGACGHEEEPMPEEVALEKQSLDSRAESTTTSLDFDLPDTIPDFEHEPPHQSSVEDDIPISTVPDFEHEPAHQSSVEDDIPISTVPESQPEELASSVDSRSDVTLNKEAGVSLSDSTTVRISETEDSSRKTDLADHDEHILKEEDETDTWEVEEPPSGVSGSGLSPTSDGPPSFKSISGKIDEANNGSGSLSRLSGLGRAARRQFATILDEFWEQLFDFHGQITQEAKGKNFHVLLGLDQKNLSSSKIADMVSTPYMQTNFSSFERGSVYPSPTRDFDYYKQQLAPNPLTLSSGSHLGSASRLPSVETIDAQLKSLYGSTMENSERRYSSLRLPLPVYSEERDQPATIHGYQIASYLSKMATDRHPDPLDVMLDSPTARYASLSSNYGDMLNLGVGHAGYGSMLNSSICNTGATLTRTQDESLYYGNSSLMGGTTNIGSASYPKKYHSLPDISGRLIPNKTSSLGSKNTQWISPIGPKSSVDRNVYDQFLSPNLLLSSRADTSPLPFDKLSPSNLYRDAFTMPPPSNGETKSLWSRQPFEQFSMSGKSWDIGPHHSLESILNDSETKLLQSFRNCIMKLLYLEGSEWLFCQNDGIDEELIDRLAAREKFLYEAESKEATTFHDGESPYNASGRSIGSGPRKEEAANFVISSVPHCGEGCIWRTGIIVSFGVWCVHRILRMSLMESRPELWGKYTYVLNRLQGILELAFFKPRSSLAACFCLQIPALQGNRTGPAYLNGKGSKNKSTTASLLLDLIKDVEAAVSSRKGRAGTAAGDVAFPKGKENLASVLKRYKRRLWNKPVAPEGGTPTSRRAPYPPASFS